MKNIHIATFTMPIAYIIGKFRPTRLPTPLKLGKHRLTARFTNYILHQFNSFSGYSFLDSSFLFFSSSSSESGCSSALGKFHPRDPTPWSPSTVVSGQNLNAGHFLHPTRSEEHTSELQSRRNLVCRLLLENKKEFKLITKKNPDTYS